MEKFLIQIDNIELSPGQSESLLREIIEKKYNVKIHQLKIVRKSLDARKKSKIVYKYRILVEVDEKDRNFLLKNKEITDYSAKKHPQIKYNKNLSKLRVIIVGAGPAGLFCALRLIELGVKVIIVERGKKVEERATDIKLLKEKGVLNPESNILFGEGGAGTWSDGKLTTRINKPGIGWFFDQMVKHGASERILFEAKPHVGTDKLYEIMQNVRKKITDSGSEIFFSEKMTDLIIKENKIVGIVTGSNKEYLADKVVLATGHSARDVYHLLKNKNIILEKKGFAVGSRIEHSSEIINSIQYGKFSKNLPAADYRLVYNDKKSKHAVYSFCMCPGGEVINSSSEENALCVNGMSNSKRDSVYSNAAIVVSVHPDDLEDDPFAGVKFQQNIEKKAYNNGGGGFIAPAQTVNAFLKGQVDKQIDTVSYLPGVVPGSLNEFLPAWIIELIKTGLKNFDKSMKGFLEHGVLIGAETRTSSPVRILREKESCQAKSVENLYPVGEGAGYAGGIVSSAVDGIKVADIICSEK